MYFNDISFGLCVTKEDSDFLQSPSVSDPSLSLISIQLLPASLQVNGIQGPKLCDIFAVVLSMRTKPHLFSSSWLWRAWGWKTSCTEAFQYPISLQTHIKFVILFEVSRKILTDINWVSGSVFLTTLLLVWYSNPCGRWEWKAAEAVFQRSGILKAQIIHSLTSLASPSLLLNLF